MGIVNKTIDAASHLIPWEHINWRKANKMVRRLQARIVKALQENNHRKVRALQFLLTRSLAASSLAVRKVTENTGKRTPGIDKKLWRTNRQKTLAIRQVRRGQYQAKPLRRIYIPKGNNKSKKRPLSIPCMDDRAKQALYLMALDPIAEYYADLNSYGFRKKRSTHDAIAAINLILSKRHSPQWILEGDIKGCFDHISHQWLLRMIPINKRVLAQWLKAGYVEKSIFYSSDDGTPQGGIISPTLANLTLDGLELQLKTQFKKQKVNVIRYADDFIITGTSESFLKDKIKPEVERFLKIRGLSLSKEKTHITHIKDGFEFLGFHIKKFDNKLLIKPAKSKIKQLLQKVKGITQTSMSADIVIARLNPVIRGWANYYRHVASSRSFSYVDHHIWRIIWVWAKRRHPKKGLKWIKKKYFKTSNRSKWEFVGTTEKQKNVFLVKCRSFKIKLHVKIRSKANPYDPDFTEYFEKRQHEAKAFLRSKTLQKLWTIQNGRCPICNNPITMRSGWHAHHITRRCDGGETNTNNLVLLHPVCHEQWHQRDYETWAGLSRDNFKRA